MVGFEPRIQSFDRPRSGDRTQSLNCSLPKTFQLSAGDYRLFGSENLENWSLETGAQLAKARRWRAFLRVSGTFSLNARLPGWRRSADRTRLQENSLLTGNFTGNFANLGE
jgi:hypothetical protein